MRRNQPEKREIIPDVKYQNITVTLLTNRIMRKGKKSTAISMIYDALNIVAEKTGKNPIEVLEQALKNVGPQMEVRPRRVGGATYQVPMEVSSHRRLTLAMRWVIDSAKARSGKSFAENSLLRLWMPLPTRVLLFANVKKHTKWLKQTALSHITGCNLSEWKIIGN